MSVRRTLENIDGGVKLACITTSLAFLVSASAYLGWQFDSDSLQSFGHFDHASQPVVSVCFGLLALGILSGIFERTPLALLFALAPAAIGLISILRIAGVDLGQDGMAAFGTRLTGMSVDEMRPGLVNSMILLLLSFALAMGLRRDRLSDGTSALTTDLALGLTILGFSHILFIEGESGSSDPEWNTSLPGTIASLLICISMLAWVSERAFAANFDTTPSHRVSVFVFTVILVSPAIVSLVELWFEENGIMSSAMAELVAALSTITVVGLLLFWASTRISQERKRVTTALRALDSAAVALTDMDGRILRWSAGCARLYGWSPEDAVGKLKADLVQSRFLTMSDALDGGRARKLIERRKDGIDLRVVENRHVIVQPDGEPMVAMAMTDVTDLLEAQEALRDAQTRLALAIEAHSVGIFEWDVVRDHISWSPGSEQRLGLKPGSIHSLESWQAMIDPADRSAIMETMAEVVADRSPHFSFHYHFRHPQGASRAIEGSAACFYNEQGELERTVGVNIDVSEREDREIELRARESELRSILESVPDALIVVDEAGKIQRFSSAAERIFGYAEGDLLGRSYLQLAPDDLKAHFEMLLSRAVAGGRAFGQSLLTAARRADGQPIPVEVRSAQAVIGDKKLITLFIRDVTERLNSERKLSELSTELMHASRLSAMGEMAAGLAHELNQPLGATVNFITAAELLVTSEGADPSRVQDLLQMARGEAMRTAEIIRRLRTFVTKGEVMLMPEPVEEVVTEAVNLVAAGYVQSGVRIGYDFGARGRLALIDRVQVQQVLVNLLRNSIEALSANTPDQRCINIATRPLEDMIEISVSDNGPGLPQQALEQPFKAFVSTKAEGMGVGLSICRRIVEAHGGEFRVENGSEGGAIFTFTVPESTGEELIDP